MPMTGYAVLGAGLPSLVIRVIGTSIAIVWTLVPLNRIHAEGVGLVVGILFLAEHGRKSPEIDGIEHRPQVDGEGFGALPGEHPGAGAMVQ